ncbi:tyrosine-type recombinase/integrase [Nocardia takedensis]|uniref:tyrosine-type recombinase/integrase n=1 Tax=Nocardia takedensis TaxID=259390 RepID=UPI003F76C05B
MNAADFEAARLLLQRMNIRPEDLLADPTDPAVPTFAEYVPRVIDAAPAGARRTYLPYWHKLRDHWPDRSIAEPTSLELQQLVEHTRRHAVVRRNSREGRSAAEHMVCAIRHLYRHAVASQYIPASRNPATALAKPRRQRSPRRALSTHQLTQINHIAATTGDDPDLDTLLLRLHLETACRTGSALRLHPEDIDPEFSQIRLFGKGGTIHWQPISPTLTARLLDHSNRGGDPSQQLLRYRHGRPITRRRYDHLWQRLGRHLPWITTHQITTHWLRHTTLTWVERHHGYAIARGFAAHTEPTGRNGATLTYVQATITEIANAVADLTNEPHPLATSDDTAAELPLGDVF